MTDNPIPIILEPESTTPTRYGGDVILNIRDLLTDIDLSPLFEGWRPKFRTQLLFRSGKFAMQDDDGSNEVHLYVDDYINQDGNFNLHIPAFTDDDDTLLLQNHPQIINNKVLGTNISVGGDFDFGDFAILNATISGANNNISNIADTSLLQITDKAKLPSPTVYTDQNNTYGVGAIQAFRSGNVRIFDPINASNFITLATADQAVNVTANFPLMASSDTFTFINQAQVLTQKEIDSINNTLKNLGNSNYEVFESSGLWKARNTKTGAITSSNASLTTVLQAAINALTASRTVIETVKVKGTGTLDLITLPSYTRLDLTDAKITFAQHDSPTSVGYLFVNSDTTNGNTRIEIIGGIVDGNRSNQYPYTGSPPADEDTANIVQFTKVTHGKVLNVEINNTPSRAVRLRDSVNCTVAHCISDLANAEAFQARGGSANKFLFNYVTNSMASFITTHECPNCLIHGNYGKTNTGAALNSGYNISSTNTIFTDNYGTDSGSAVLTMSEGSASHLGSFTLIANNELSYSRAAEGMTAVSSLNQTGLIIKGNKFHHNFRHGCRIASTKTAIEIEGNHAYENGQGGISLHSGATLFPDHVSINNNFCWNNNTSSSSTTHEKCGIAVFSSTVGEFVTNVSVHHNHCFDTHPVNADKTQIYGIYIEDLTNGSISFNNCVGNKTDGMLIEGTNSGLREFENIGYSLTKSIATLTGTETWTNKTLTAPVINSGILSGTFTLPNDGNGITLLHPTFSGGEKFLTFQVQDASSDSFVIKNQAGSNAQFIPLLEFIQSSSNNMAASFRGMCDASMDSGTTALFRFDGRRLDAGLSTRPILDIASFGTVEYVFGTTQADFKNNAIINSVLTSPVINSATLSGTFTLPSGSTPITFSKPNSGAEMFMDFVIDDVSGSRLRIQNSTGSAGVFAPQFTFRNLTTNAGFPAGLYMGEILDTADTGTAGVFRIDGRIGSPSSSALAVRPMFDITNFGTQEYVFGVAQADFKSNSLVNAVINESSNTITQKQDYTFLIYPYGSFDFRVKRGSDGAIVYTSNNGAGPADALGALQYCRDELDNVSPGGVIELDVGIYPVSATFTLDGNLHRYQKYRGPGDGSNYGPIAEIKASGDFPAVTLDGQTGTALGFSFEGIKFTYAQDGYTNGLIRWLDAVVECTFLRCSFSDSGFKDGSCFKMEILNTVANKSQYSNRIKDCIARGSENFIEVNNQAPNSTFGSFISDLNVSECQVYNSKRMLKMGGVSGAYCLNWHFNRCNWQYDATNAVAANEGVFDYDSPVSCWMHKHSNCVIWDITAPGINYANVGTSVELSLQECNPSFRIGGSGAYLNKVRAMEYYTGGKDPLNTGWIVPSATSIVGYGLLYAPSALQTGTYAYDSISPYLTYPSTTTQGTNTGTRRGPSVFKTRHKPLVEIYAGPNNTSVSRCYHGLGTNIVLGDTDVILGTTDSGIYAGWRSTDTNIMIFHHDGDGSAMSVIDTGLAKTTSMWKCAFLIDPTQFQWLVSTPNGTVVGTPVTTQIPDQDTLMAFSVQAQPSSTTQILQQLRYAKIVLRNL